MKRRISSVIKSTAIAVIAVLIVSLCACTPTERYNIDSLSLSPGEEDAASLIFANKHIWKTNGSTSTVAEVSCQSMELKRYNGEYYFRTLYFGSGDVKRFEDAPDSAEMMFKVEESSLVAVDISDRNTIFFHSEFLGSEDYSPDWEQQRREYAVYSLLS